QTPGVPLAPAMTAANRGKVAPRLRGGRGPRARCRCDAAGGPQGQKAVPAWGGAGLRALWVVLAALGQHQDLPPRRGAKSVRPGEQAQGVHHTRLGAVLRESRRLALPLALAGKG